MKGFLLALALVVMVSGCGIRGRLGGGGGCQSFETTPEKVIASLEQGEEIVVVFVSKPCAPCTALKVKVATSPRLREALYKRFGNEAYIIDVNDPHYKDDIKDINIKGTPTTVIYKKDGKDLIEVKRLVGNHPVDTFVKFVRSK